MDAQKALGSMYADGRGVVQDFMEAAKWYRKAAEQGHLIAQDELGRMYALGRGVAQDYVLAHMWLNLAAAKGMTDAAKERDELTSRMTSAQIAEAQRLAREWKPAK